MTVETRERRHAQLLRWNALCKRWEPLVTCVGQWIWYSVLVLVLGRWLVLLLRP